MNKDSLEHIIREKFNGASSTIPSESWGKIQSQIDAATSSTLTGSSSVFTKIIIGVSLSAAVTLSAFFFKTSTHTKKETKREQVINSNTEDNSPILDFKTIDKPSKIDKPIEIKIHQNIHRRSSETESTKESLNNNSASNLVENNTSKLEKTTISPKADLSESISNPVALPQNLQIEPNKTEKPIVPTKIIDTQVSANPLIYSFKLDQIDEKTNVQWFVNEEFITNKPELVHEQSYDAELTIMAVISSEEEINQLFKNVRVELPMFVSIPNIFSPNGDAFNPDFGIDQEKSKNVKSYSIIIRSAQGELIFESSENQINWNGDLPNKNPAPEGAYYYILQAQSALGQTKIEKGKVQLTR